MLLVYTIFMFAVFFTEVSHFIMRSFHSVIIYINIFTKSVCFQFMFTVYSEATSLLIVSNDTEFPSRPLKRSECPGREGPGPSETQATQKRLL